MGRRSLAARPVGHVAGADADDRRGPLLHRQLPEDAAGRLHADVRADAGPPQHLRSPEHRFRGYPRRRRLRSDDLYRADRRVLRLPVRRASLPLADLPARDAGAGALPAGGGGQYAGGARAVYPDDGVQAPDGAGASLHRHLRRVPEHRRGSLLCGAERGERGALPEVPGARSGDAERGILRAAWHLPLLQTWTRWWRRR